MNILNIILFIFFFSILSNDVNTFKCNVKLSDKGLKDLTLSSIFESHRYDIDNLMLWVHFFFYHFSHNLIIIWYLKNLNIKSIDPVENKCFKRGLTVFLIYYYGYSLISIKNKGQIIDELKDTFKNVNRVITDDFFESIKSDEIFNLVDTIIMPFKDIQNFYREFFRLKDDTNLSIKTLEDIYSKRKKHIELINGKEDKNIKNDTLKVDYNYLYKANLKNLNVRSDLTLSTTGVLAVMERSTKLLVRNRSKTFQLVDDRVNDVIFGNCTKNDKVFYYKSPDDLISSFFSMMKKKMLLGYERFLKEFDNAVIKKNYKLERLKGLRYIQYFFRKNSFNHFVKIHLNLILTEHKFLLRDFITLFDNTMSCYDKIKEISAKNGYIFLRAKASQ